MNPVLMIQGTSSDVGKSLIVTALCRWFARKGLKVAPFKAQNMALNSSVTQDGAEIGCAQYLQAQAAGQVASALMNPILLKPEGERNSQVVVLGQATGSCSFKSYHERKPELRHIILESLGELRRTHDLVIIEGAGSPAEINLKAHDLVNMFVATSTKAPVLLVGDIDRGGVFASLLGTMEWLDPEEKELVAGFIINKFRGDPSLLYDGLALLEARTQRKVYGLMPYLRDHGLGDEDSLALDRRPQRLYRSEAGIDIAIVRFPRLSNYDEFVSLERETGTTVAYVSEASCILEADLVILPGSKATVSDLGWLRSRGLDQAIQQRLAKGRPILAICGGYQMLGARIEDPYGAEQELGTVVEGLGLLPTYTRFAAHKTTTQVQVQARRPFWGLAVDETWQGYEIHMGQVYPVSTPNRAEAPWVVIDSQSPSIEGCLGADGALLGTLIHGLFENETFRLQILNFLRQRKGLKPLGHSIVTSRLQAFDQLADALETHCDMPALVRLLHLEGSLIC
jgi:adenosylcobyric acid synthase